MFIKNFIVLFFTLSLAKNSDDDFESIFDDKGNYTIVGTVVDDKGNHNNTVDDKGNRTRVGSVVDDKGRVNSSEVANEASIKAVDSMMVLCLFQLLM